MQVQVSNHTKQLDFIVALFCEALRRKQYFSTSLRSFKICHSPLFSEVIVGQHDQPIKCVEFSPNVNTVVTGSWDCTVKLWDPRTPCNAGSFTQPDKVRFHKRSDKHGKSQLYFD